MFTIRHNVFETNSSSEHALKVNRDVPRKKEDFPLLNDQGILELEATRYWESGVSVSSIRDIMEYICLLCYSVETGMAVIAAGHHRSEIFGVENIANWLIENGVDARFIDLDNPI